MSDRQIIQNPTWEDISNLISDHSVNQMKKHGLDLRDYTQVSAMAHKIYYYLGYKLMPLGNPWSNESIATYNNWLINGCPIDAAHQAEIEATKEQAILEAGSRVRKDIDMLDEGEQDLLVRAFQGLLDRDPKDASEYDPKNICYFNLAANHWYPVPTFCQHHIYNYLPWHRYQMLDFENALRSIPGCEEVTLPYWNIETGNVPDLLKKAPFANYTFPMDVYPEYYTPPEGVTTGRKGTTTARNKDRCMKFDPEENKCTEYLDKKYEGKVYQIDKIRECINNARTAPKWSEYNGITDYDYDASAHIIRAHDLGHNGTGSAMSNQDIAAYDPIFWFFHSNWDRLWWEWQVSREATDLDSFRATLEESDDQRWLMDPQMSISDPFGKHNYDSIDLTKLGVSYAKPKPQEKRLMETAPLLARGSSWRDKDTGKSEKNTFTISKDNLNKVSLRVKGINRINISGSFYVVLLIGGEEVGRDGFFQSTFSGNCENCVNQANVSFDFIFDRNLLSDEDGTPKEIKVEVINALTSKVQNFEEIGNPTINIRMLH